MPRVLLATEKPFAASAVEGIEGVFATAGYELVKLEKYAAKADLLAAVADAEAMIIRSDACDKEVLEAAGKLKVVVRAGAGVDNIDLNAATAKEVCAMNTPGQNSNAVAELLFGMLVTTVRNHYDGSSGFELRGKTLGLYGCGNVSRFVIEIAKGFKMDVHAYDPFLKPEQIEACGATPVTSVADLFKCQIVSLHCPATPETTKSINAALLMGMPKNAILVNTSRKEVVDEDDLKKVLADRSDFYYVADVKPDCEKELQEQLGDKFKYRCLFTAKKMGAQTTEANNNAGIAAANQIVAFFEQGDRKFQVNKPGQTF